MSRPIQIDVNAPLASIREAAGVTKADVARARGVKPPSVNNAEDAGPAVSVETVRATADALGYELRMSIVKK